ncbi:hypothetical protein HTZ77_14520 [Nonomuraea sp. SMC257]|uniref:Uncharacterized protein n=1 Tax=Nonomuraea montanisoli TaxID=2741721 RepID=A0A7Y6I6M6_9ACTN|nr:hypothetical protein [Nonomuraea montanisoli]NUW32637.1 hypothetical protein [Nonomuraea montanisoli]
MREKTQDDRFRNLPERPDPATWRSGRDESPLPQAIAEPAMAEDAALRWVAPELEAARRISDAVVRRRGSRD